MKRRTILLVMLVSLVGTSLALYWLLPKRQLRVLQQNIYWSAYGLIDPHYGLLGPEAVYAEVGGRRQVPCPSDALAIVALGQSNASNSLENVTGPSRAEPANNISRGKCYIAQDPLLGAEGSRGSLWTGMAQRLASKIRRPVILLTPAVGNSSAGEWADRDFWL